MKTNKSITKRFKITKNKKVLRRPQHQNHLNVTDSGKETRQKRKKKKVEGATKKKILSS